jgi:hypothetical protein
MSTSGLQKDDIRMTSELYQAVQQGHQGLYMYTRV